MTPEQRQGLTPEEQQHYKFWSPSHMTPPEQGYPLSPEFGNFMGRPQAQADTNLGSRVAFNEPEWMNEGFSGRSSMAEEQGMYGA